MMLVRRLTGVRQRLHHLRPEVALHTVRCFNGAGGVVDQVVEQRLRERPLALHDLVDLLGFVFTDHGFELRDPFAIHSLFGLHVDLRYLARAQVRGLRKDEEKHQAREDVEAHRGDVVGATVGRELHRQRAGLEEQQLQAANDAAVELKGFPQQFADHGWQRPAVVRVLLSTNAAEHVPCLGLAQFGQVVAASVLFMAPAERTNGGNVT